MGPLENKDIYLGLANDRNFALSSLSFKRSKTCSFFLSHLKQSLKSRIWDFGGWKQVFKGVCLLIFLCQDHGVNQSINSIQLCLLKIEKQKEKWLFSLFSMKTNAFYVELSTAILAGYTVLALPKYSLAMHVFNPSLGFLIHEKINLE